MRNPGPIVIPILFAFLGSALFVEARAAPACPSLPWLAAALKDPNTPACPKNGETLLPDTAPPIALVISRGESPSEGAKMTEDFVLESLEASGNRVPLILLPGVDESEMGAIRARIEKETGPESPYASRRAEWLKALTAVPGSTRFQWQQDYFKSAVDPSTGLPSIRPVRGYDNQIDGPSQARTLGQVASGACPAVKIGDLLPPESEKKYEFENAAMGGDSLGIPGGVYLHGKNQNFSTYGRYLSGPGAAEGGADVAIDTSWLKVGHVDEIAAVLPDRNGKAPCDFAISLASPDLALKLLTDPKTKDQPFFSFAGGPEESSRRGDSPVVRICRAVADYRAALAPKESGTPPPAPGTGTKSSGRGADNSGFTPFDSIRDWFPFGIREARAGVVVGTKACPDLKTITNGEVAAAIRASPHPGLGDFNAMIQSDLDSNEKTIRAALIEHGCPNAKIVRVPDLFYGGIPIERRPEALVSIGGKSKRFDSLTEAEKNSLPPNVRYQGLPDRSASSILPNPTNAVSVSGTVILPKIQNSAFENSVSAEYSKLGIPTRDVDTWGSAHVRDGNLHCSTNALRICRP